MTSPHLAEYHRKVQIFLSKNPPKTNVRWAGPFLHLLMNLSESCLVAEDVALLSTNFQETFLLHERECRTADAKLSPFLAQITVL